MCSEYGDYYDKDIYLTKEECQKQLIKNKNKCKKSLTKQGLLLYYKCEIARVVIKNMQKYWKSVDFSINV